MSFDNKINPFLSQNFPPKKSEEPKSLFSNEASNITNETKKISLGDCLKALNKIPKEFGQLGVNFQLVNNSCKQRVPQTSLTNIVNRVILYSQQFFAALKEALKEINWQCTIIKIKNNIKTGYDQLQKNSEQFNAQLLNLIKNPDPSQDEIAELIQTANKISNNLREIHLVLIDEILNKNDNIEEIIEDRKRPSESTEHFIAESKRNKNDDDCHLFSCPFF